MCIVDREMRPRHAPRMATQQVAGKWVVLDIKSGQYYALDGVAGRIWQLCDGTRNVGEIAAALSDEYDTQGEPVEDDVAAFVSEFVDESLLV
jgi:coenzyme PQQ biosynthesis protein PqqD